MNSVKRTACVLSGSIVLCAVWYLFAWQVVPALIHQAYSGESLPILNNIIEGQAEHPPEDYLAKWHRFCVTGTEFLVLAACVVFSGIYVARRRSMRLAVGGLVLAGVLLGVASTGKYGPGLSPDSCSYVACSESLLAGNGFSRPWGEYSHWPPLYPSLMALLGVLSIPPKTAALVINAAAFATLVFVVSYQVYEITKSRWFAWAGGMGVVCSVPLHNVSVFVWSEIVFILLAVLALWKVGRFLETGENRNLRAAVVFAAFACLQRYVGVVLVGASALSLLLWGQGSVRRRFTTATIFSGLSVLPLSVWIMRNVVVCGSLSGGRHPSEYGFAENVQGAWTIVSSWFFPFSPAVGMLLAAAMTATFFMGVVIWPRIEGERPGLRFITLAPHSVFLFCYIGFMVVVASVVHFDPLNDRLLSPAYPVILIGVLLAGACLRQESRNAPAPGRRIALAVFVVCGVTALAASFMAVRETTVGGYASDSWQKSPTALWLLEHPLEGKVYSNAPDALYVLSSHPAMTSPSRDSSKSLEDGWLVWFDKKDRSYLVTEEELLDRYALTKEREFADGRVYRIGSQESTGIGATQVLSLLAD